MKNYNEWKEDFAPAAANDVPPDMGVGQIGPQNRLTTPVRVANQRFDRMAGDNLSSMNSNQKLHYLVDAIMSVLTQDPDSLNKDRQVLTKLRSLIVKIDSAVKQHAHDV
jgi:hypothetical protein